MVALVSKILTRHMCHPMPSVVKIAQKENAKVSAATKTTHYGFKLGSCVGFTPAILTTKQFVKAFNSVCKRAGKLDVNT